MNCIRLRLPVDIDYVWDEIKGYVNLATLYGLPLSDEIQAKMMEDPDIQEAIKDDYFSLVEGEGW